MVQTSAFAYGTTVEKIAEGMTVVATPVVIDGNTSMKLTSWQWSDGIAVGAFGDLGALLVPVADEVATERQS